MELFDKAISGLKPLTPEADICLLIRYYEGSKEDKRFQCIVLAIDREWKTSEGDLFFTPSDTIDGAIQNVIDSKYSEIVGWENDG